MTAASLAGLLASTRADDRPIAERGGALVTVGRLRRDVERNARRLAAIGVRNALLTTAGSYAGTVGLFALFAAGAAVTLPPRVQAEPRALGCDLVVGDAQGGAGFALDLVEAADEGAPRERMLDPACCRIALFTAGSTGAPKRIEITLAALEREALMIDAVLARQVPPQATIHSMASFHHLYGLTFGLVWPLATGRPFVDRIAEFWENLFARPLGGAGVIATPAHLYRLDGFAPLPAAQRPSLVLSGAAPLSDEAAAMATRILGIAPTEFFGSTETGAVCTRRRDRPDPPWRPLPGVRIDRTEDGRMRVFTPMLEIEGGCEGADLIDLEADGSFRIRGRVDRIAKIEGKRVNLGDLERDLKALAPVADAAVVVLGEAPPVLGAVIVANEAGRARVAAVGGFRFQRELRAALAAGHDRAALPRRWRLVEALPVGFLGKRQQRELIALFESAPRPTEPRLRAQRAIEAGVELDLELSPELAQLDGHFPGEPIVPGVALVDWAVGLARRHLGLEIESAQNFRVKFHRALRPGATVTLALRRRPGGDLDFAYRDGATLLSAGEIRLAAR